MSSKSRVVVCPHCHNDLRIGVNVTITDVRLNAKTDIAKDWFSELTIDQQQLILLARSEGLIVALTEAINHLDEVRRPKISRVFS